MPVENTKQARQRTLRARRSQLQHRHLPKHRKHKNKAKKVKHSRRLTTDHVHDCAAPKDRVFDGSGRWNTVVCSCTASRCLSGTARRKSTLCRLHAKTVRDSERNTRRNRDGSGSFRSEQVPRQKSATSGHAKGGGAQKHGIKFAVLPTTIVLNDANLFKYHTTLFHSLLAGMTAAVRESIAHESGVLIFYQDGPDSFPLTATQT